MADARTTNTPTTQQGAKQQRAQEALDRAKKLEKKSDFAAAGKAYAEAEKFFGEAGDRPGAQEAGLKRQHMESAIKIKAAEWGASQQRGHELMNEAIKELHQGRWEIAVHKLEAAERLFAEAGNSAGAREAAIVKTQAQAKSKEDEDVKRERQPHLSTRHAASPRLANPQPSTLIHKNAEHIRQGITTVAKSGPTLKPSTLTPPPQTLSPPDMKARPCRENSPTRRSP